MRFLFVTGEGGGNVPPTMAVVERLVSTGHTVDVQCVPWIASHIDAKEVGAALASRATAVGATPVGLDEWASASPQPQPVPEFAELARFANVITMSFFTDMQPWIAAAVGRQLDRVDYDCVVLDQGVPAASAACQRRGVPYAVIVSSVNISRWWPGRPCPGTGEPVSSAPAVHESLAADMTRLIDATFLHRINAAREREGLDPYDHITSVDDHARAVLFQTLAEFDPGSANAPSNCRYVGPCLQRGSGELTVALDDSRPLVVMSPTTTSFAVGQVPFVKASVEALGSLPVQAVITVGRSLDPARIAGRDNVTVLGHADHHALLPHASALITHCGHGTTMTGLRFGVPLIGVPDFSDQVDIAVRIDHFGIGVTRAKPVSAEDIRTAVEQVLDDPACAAGAAKFSSLLAADDGPARAAEALLAAC